MIAMNYTITDANGAPLPVGTPVVLIVNGGQADVWADPANPGRFQLKFPNPGPVTALVSSPLGQKVWSDTIPAGGGEATANNPLVLLPF